MDNSDSLNLIWSWITAIDHLQFDFGVSYVFSATFFQLLPSFSTFTMLNPSWTGNSESSDLIPSLMSGIVDLGFDLGALSKTFGHFSNFYPILILFHKIELF